MGLSPAVRSGSAVLVAAAVAATFWDLIAGDRQSSWVFDDRMNFVQTVHLRAPTWPASAQWILDDGACEC